MSDSPHPLEPDEIRLLDRYALIANAVGCDHCGYQVRNGAHLEPIEDRVLCEDCDAGYSALRSLKNGTAVRP